GTAAGADTILPGAFSRVCSAASGDGALVTEATAAVSWALDPSGNAPRAMANVQVKNVFISCIKIRLFYGGSQNLTGSFGGIFTPRPDDFDNVLKSLIHSISRSHAQS